MLVRETGVATFLGSSFVASEGRESPGVPARRLTYHFRNSSFLIDVATRALGLPPFTSLVRPLSSTSRHRSSMVHRLSSKQSMTATGSKSVGVSLPQRS